MKEIPLMENNPIFIQLFTLGLARLEDLEQLYPRVRDREDISVWRSKRSEVIFLSRCAYADEHYESTQGFSYWESENREEARLKTFPDDQRRANFLAPLVRGKSWLDFGTGLGGILMLVGSDAANRVGLEPQPDVRKSLQADGYRVVGSLSELSSETFDVITLFHVLEHLVDPISTLMSLRKLLTKNGRIFVEVPHARDILLSFFKVEAFMKFTFWSEHFILHTRKSLSIFLKKSGFRSVRIRGVQRFPLANHLHWLARGEPGGHEKWSLFRQDFLERGYEKFLRQEDRTDTLLAEAW